MNQTLLRKVMSRAQASHTETDQPEFNQSSIYPKLSETDLTITIRELGFAPPNLYIDLMQTIGNGGFGPGCGLMGLVGGATDDMGSTAVSLYNTFAQSGSDDPAWKWPHGLLPICHWGCAIYSCIDCTQKMTPVKTWDPNEWEDGTSPVLAIRASGMSLEEWLESWSEGVDLWKKMYPST